MQSTMPVWHEYETAQTYKLFHQFFLYTWLIECMHINHFFTFAKHTRCGLIVIASLQTLLRRKATGEKGPATELEPRTYTLLRSFSHTHYRSQSQILCLPSPYVPVEEAITAFLPAHKEPEQVWIKKQW